MRTCLSEFVSGCFGGALSLSVCLSVCECVVVVRRHCSLVRSILLFYIFYVVIRVVSAFVELRHFHVRQIVWLLQIYHYTYLYIYIFIFIILSFMTNSTTTTKLHTFALPTFAEILLQFANVLLLSVIRILHISSLPRHHLLYYIIIECECVCMRLSSVRVRGVFRKKRKLARHATLHIN